MSANVGQGLGVVGLHLPNHVTDWFGMGRDNCMREFSQKSNMR
jgi:hypothetical protein